MHILFFQFDRCNLVNKVDRVFANAVFVQIFLHTSIYSNKHLESSFFFLFQLHISQLFFLNQVFYLNGNQNVKKKGKKMIHQQLLVLQNIEKRRCKLESKFLWGEIRKQKKTMHLCRSYEVSCVVNKRSCFWKAILQIFVKSKWWKKNSFQFHLMSPAWTIRVLINCFSNQACNCRIKNKMNGFLDVFLSKICI